MILFNEGRSLRLRQTGPEDAPILLRAYQDKSFLRLYRSNNAPPTQEQLTDILTEYATGSPIEMGYVEFMIEHKQHGPIGVVALSDYSPLHKRAEFLIGLFEEKYRSRGHGTEATLLVLDLAFNNYQLHKVYSYVYQYNEFSHKNMIKFGFKHEGTLKDHHYLLKEQRFVNLYLNAITEADFRNNDKIRRYSLRLLGRDVTKSPQVIKISAENKLPVEADKQFLEDWLRAD